MIAKLLIAILDLSNEETDSSFLSMPELANDYEGWGLRKGNKHVLKKEFFEKTAVLKTS